MKASAGRRYKKQVSGMGGYGGHVSGHDGKMRKRRENTGRICTNGLYPARPDTEDSLDRYPSMPETWNVAESKSERQVFGMAGYGGRVSGHDGKAVSHRREKTAKDGKRQIQGDCIRQCRKHGMLPRASAEKRYPAWEDTERRVRKYHYTID
jgi:hypothetical protein